MKRLSRAGGKSPIGIDFEGRSVRAAQLVSTPQGWLLTAALALPRLGGPAEPLDRAEVDGLSGALARHGFTGKRVVLAIPEDKLLTGILELPPRTSGAPLDEIARAELANMHGYDPQAAEAVCWDLPVSSRRGTTQAMGVACRHDDAEAVLKAFDGSSLDVQALDSRLHAVVRACQSVLPQTGITAVLDLEWNGTMLLLVFEGTVFYQRTMSEGAVRQLVQAITEGLALDEEAALLLLAEVGLAPRGPEHASHAEAISPMISKYLDVMAHSLQSPLAYAAAQYPGSSVSGLLLVGHGAGIPGVADVLQQRLGMSVRAVAPADVVQGQPSLGAKAQDPSLVAAIGLARFTCA